ncbi:MAG TPA: matrixin family metalloprotease, partial [Planctomycetota bacterium]|nr:matrixin family metalloprotease [Planctomycetota bacterium]
ALIAGLSLGFVLLSPPHKWQSNQLPRNWRIGMATGENSLASAYVQASAQNAVARWNTAITTDSSWSGPAPFTTSVPAGLGNVGFVNDGLNTISWEDPQHVLSAGVLAATTTGYFSSSPTEVVNGTAFGRFTDSDLVGNDGVDFTSYQDAEDHGANGNQYDLGSILVHEFGHSLGLDHTTVQTQITMYPSIGANDFSKARLDDDDVNGGRFIYVNGYHAVNYAPGTQLVCDPLFLGLSTTTFKGNSSVYLRVTIVDESGNLVSGASVTVSVTRPNGTTGTGTAGTNANGQVVFNSGKAQHGAYSASVTGVTKAGMSFNAGAGKSADTASF